MEKGLIQVYTGDGKGKTTAAFGLALRAAGAGLNVYIGQFAKGRCYNEIKALKKINNINKAATQQYLIGLCLNSLKRFDEAKLYIDSSLIVFKKFRDTKRTNECLLGMANTYKGMHQYDSALKYYNSLLTYFIEKKEIIPVSSSDVFGEDNVPQFDIKGVLPLA